MRYSRLRLRQIVPVARHGADDLSGDKTTYRYLTQSRGGDQVMAVIGEGDLASTGQDVAEGPRR
jgi:hypothetical protein